MKKYYYVKCALDFILSLTLLVLTSWIMLICAIAVKLDDPSGPVFYNAFRAGKNCKLFKMYKFRTMKTEFTGHSLPGENTLTRVGRFLRRTSLDELPQFINILAGQMAFIGPRPLLPSYVPYYTEGENVRHRVRPGITGLAQIRGRVNLAWEERFAIDAEYVENLSLRLDMKIFFDTFRSLTSQNDVLVTANSGVSAPFDVHRRRQLESSDNPSAKYALTPSLTNI